MSGRDIAAASKGFFDSFDPIRLGILGRRNTERRLEEAVQVGRTDTKLRTQRRKLYGISGVRLDVPANVADQFRLRLHLLAGMTSTAGPKTSLLGGLTSWEKNHLSSVRPTRRTGWAAVNPGRTNGVYKPAVKFAVPKKYRLPPFIRVSHSFHSWDENRAVKKRALSEYCFQSRPSKRVEEFGYANRNPS